MFVKYVSLALVVMLLNPALCSTAMAGTKKDAKLADQVKAAITRLGADGDVKVEAKLKDGTKLKGFLSKVKESSFVLILEGTGTSEEIQYLQVKQIKGQNFSNGKKILVRASVIISALLLYGYLFSHSSDY